MLKSSVTPTPPDGLLIELVTPLTATGDLDAEGLSRLVERVAPYAAGIVAASPGLGEALGLPDSVRRELFSGLLKQWPGPGPLFFGVTADTQEQTGDLIQRFEAECRSRHYDYQIHWLDLPLWYHSNRGLPQYYRQLLGTLRHPLILLNQPEIIRERTRPWKHHNLRTAVVKKLTDLPEIRGMIFRGKMERFLNYHRAAGGRPDFAIYEGDESRFLTRPGAWGIISPGAQLFPSAWQAVTQACLHPEKVADLKLPQAKLWQLSQQLLELAQCYLHQPAALLKTALQALGVIKHDTTCPATVPAAPGLKKKLLDFLTRMEVLR
ncbi:MAG: dihydrodipicolinate synthase family protein [Deltaproteobacteria bacterium]|nr:dihydrodipicolinate synthase family protein [Deltaproteobacteria bacterium]MBW1953247.1 dihydrodipicolinate synthase family protein [Deltaproteobacteria bacterium]MBW1987451.1 dihydrodipicolinate synthase family protein [Deltaproteobacteria bacterium]MBW2135577.1 dihydrodipicolinate synthase family protein [Deltaproteobacteria bacterium]